MNDESDFDESAWLNNGRPLSSWEIQCIQEIERAHANVEAEIRKHESTIAEKLWALFQNTATSITQLHKDRQQGQVTLWIPFQHAATNVTTLYRACVESSSLLCDMSLKSGAHKRNRDLVEWTKSRPRRTIRREELLAFLAGRPSPSSAPRLRMPTPAGGDPSVPLHDAFREALKAGSGRQPGSPNNWGYHHHRSSRMSGGGEDVESRKRSPSDVTMDSPTHKRTRFV